MVLTGLPDATLPALYILGSLLCFIDWGGQRACSSTPPQLLANCCVFFANLLNFSSLKASLGFLSLWLWVGEKKRQKNW